MRGGGAGGACVGCGGAGPYKRCRSCSATLGRTCSEADCGRAHCAYGYCQMHYKRWKAHGDTLPRKGGKPYVGRTPEQRLAAFESKIVRTNGCWMWQGKPGGTGYGSFSIRGKAMGAHRASYTLLVGPIPDGLWVLHRCDVPLCVNPAHLFLGTAADNNADMDAKGRARRDTTAARLAGAPPLRGERNGEAKLTAAQVLAIRDDPRLHRVIAAEYGVSKPLISHIKTRRLWRHLP